MNNNIRVGNLFGIPFYVNPSWFLVLTLVTWVYGSQLQNFPQLAGISPWLLGLAAALLLFSSVFHIAQRILAYFKFSLSSLSNTNSGDKPIT